MNNPTVYMVDDDPAVLKALTRLLQVEGFHVQAFASAEAFLESHDASRRGCLVLDLKMPGMSGIALQQVLQESGCDRQIVFLTGQGQVTDSVQAMKSGAVDFLTKPLSDVAFLGAIRHAIAKDEQARCERQHLQWIRQRLATLSPREYQVLQMVTAGRLNKQIAYSLGTAEKTVKVQRAQMMEKMGATSFAELVRLTVELEIGATATRSSITPPL